MRMELHEILPESFMNLADQVIGFWIAFRILALQN